MHPALPYVYATLSAAILLLLAHYAAEKVLLARYAAALGRRADGERQIDLALRALTDVHTRIPACREDPVLLEIPLLASLGATPGIVHRRGGSCSGKSRLGIVLLHSMGIPAAQVTLYHTSGRARHCLIEATCREGTVLVDPLHGLYFVCPEGRPIGLADLRRGVSPKLRALGTNEPAEYPGNRYYEFDYRQSRTANWTVSAPRRHAYAALAYVTTGRIDEMRQPSFAEWPQLLLAVALTGVLLVVTWILG